MPITRFKIRNFKCLRDVELELTPLSVFIGKNDTGKSSALQSLDRLCEILCANDVRQLDSGKPPITLHCKAEPKAVHWSVAFDAMGHDQSVARYDYQLDLRYQGGWFLGDERLVLSRQGLELALLERDPEDASKIRVGRSTASAERTNRSVDRAAVRMFAENQGLIHREIKTAYDFLRSCRLYRLELDQLRARSKLLPYPQVELPMLARDGSGLPALLDYILSTDRAAHDRIEKGLQDVAPHVRRIQLLPWIEGNVSGKSLGFVVGDDMLVPAEAASDGILLILAYLTIVNAPGRPRIILIEEPENGINPRHLRVIVQLLRSLTTASPCPAQIIMTTHSPYLLDCVKPEEVSVFARLPNGDTAVRRLDGLPAAKELIDSGMSLGEAWYYAGEDRLMEEVLHAAAAPRE